MRWWLLFMERLFAPGPRSSRYLTMLIFLDPIATCRGKTILSSEYVLSVSEINSPNVIQYEVSAFAAIRSLKQAMSPFLAALINKVVGVFAGVCHESLRAGLNQNCFRSKDGTIWWPKVRMHMTGSRIAKVRQILEFISVAPDLHLCNTLIALFKSPLSLL